MNTKTKESLFGVYFADNEEGLHGPKGERQAGMVIEQGMSEESIIKHLIACDFLNQHQDYKVMEFGPWIVVCYSSGTAALILIYEEDFD